MTGADLVEAAVALRPQLLEEQAETEARGYYSDGLHRAFTRAGFYRMLVPSRYGGLEVDLPTYYRVVVEISRGCPSSGWMLALGSAHALQAASYWPARAQDELFGVEQFIACASFGFEDATATPVDGGYRVAGTWHFCSGVPYATHHMGLVPVSGSEEPLVVAIPREHFRMLENWGDLIGLKGSGSHSVTVDGAFVPSHHAITLGEWLAIGVSSTPGYELHGNPLYGGSFMAVALGELNSVQVGNAQGAIDEYVRLMRRPTRRVAGTPGEDRAHDPNYQRVLGLALSYTDAANSILVHCGELFHEYAREAMEGGRTFDSERTFRIYGQLMTAHKLCWEAGDMVFRAGSTSGARDGARLQRYWRDLCAFRTNGVHQHDFQASAIAQAHLGFPVGFFDQ
ncbi:MAG TPA: acyl-CoA dehydrogenase family protein [Solirubrobacteraceae bacterium]|jgi:3-hydroxy-9,10-secoandrosta-1,3,5(10)-triene-9,17-dione monooxygenase|nr:acyl-CoA dehydrogenase family protein [Solirubrobacteraceae bacterium]